MSMGMPLLTRLVLDPAPIQPGSFSADVTKLVSDDVKAVHKWRADTSAHHVGAIVASAVASWPIGSVILRRWFKGSHILSRIAFRSAVWATLAPGAVLFDYEYRLSRRTDRMKFCMRLEQRYDWWQELFRARPWPLADLEAMEEMTKLFADWHDRALNFDPLGQDPYALSDLCLATGACGNLYRSFLLLPEEEVSMAEDVRKFYIFPIMAKRCTLGLDQFDDYSVFIFGRLDLFPFQNRIEPILEDGQGTMSHGSSGEMPANEVYSNGANTNDSAEQNAQNGSNWPATSYPPLVAKGRHNDPKKDSPAENGKE